MGVFRSVVGVVEAELISADPAGALRRINQMGIELFDIRRIGELTLRFRLNRRDYNRVKGTIAKKGDSLKIVRKIGIFWTAKGFVHRPVLLAGMVLMLMLVLYLPGRICFVKVEGNLAVPTRLILEKAEECGICFGTSRREVRSERIKNALLSAIPQLQWAGVNTKGCVAVISVREKTASEEEKEQPAVSRIVAIRDGVIVKCTVEQGNGLCQVGQAVKAGDLLISGYTDCGIAIRAGRSVGEVYAQTSRYLRAVTPAEYDSRGTALEIREKYALIIGKKRINFYKDSGILGGTCDKMSTVNYMTLPGGFTLPMALVTERWIRYEPEPRELDEGRAEEILACFMERYLNNQMLAGKVIRREEEFGGSSGLYDLSGRYACIEMIGREQIEEKLEYYGKSD